MEFGEAVKARREQLEMSQAQLSELSGTSKAMISEIESGKKNPTLKVACAISVGLSCQISDLLDLPPVVQFAKLGTEDGQILIDPETNVRRRLIAPHMVQHAVQVLEFTMPPSQGVDFGADGQGVLEHMTCIRGSVTVERQGDTTESATLLPGESANYASNEVHRFLNASDSEEAVIILVIDSTRRGEPVDLSGLVEA
ncbi:MAG: helix-turn-helix domain-containing protein [Phycisphaerales bacterium JB061]